jgi:hypothetical protein
MPARSSASTRRSVSRIRSQQHLDPVHANLWADGAIDLEAFRTRDVPIPVWISLRRPNAVIVGGRPAVGGGWSSDPVVRSSSIRRG